MGPRHPLMPQEQIVLFGYNQEAGWIDLEEVARLQESRMWKYPAAAVRANVTRSAIEALSLLENRSEKLLVHFDVDVIEFTDLPVADVPHSRGLSLNESMEALRIFISSPKFGGLVITEFNAERDPHG